MKWFIALLILIVVLIAGCSQLSSVACKPNWVMGLQFQKEYSALTDDLCKSQCYATAKVTAHKIENTSQTVGPVGHTFVQNLTTCYCDVNNCNP